jgi:L-ascorbate metabolism protein UlaG (beta-lactamase superfamily)
MIKITHIGHACFTVEVGAKQITFDPYDDSIGLPMPQITAGQLFISHEHYDHNNRTAVRPRSEMMLDGPQISSSKIKSWHDDQGGKLRGENIIHVVRCSTSYAPTEGTECCTICHLGDLGTTLSDEQIREIEKAAHRYSLRENTSPNVFDVLLIPVGGTYTIDANAAREVVRQLKPRIIIPMHYFVPGLKLGIAPVDEFLTLMREDDYEIFQPDTNSLNYTSTAPPGVWVI